MKHSSPVTVIITYIINIQQVNNQVLFVSITLDMVLPPVQLRFISNQIQINYYNKISRKRGHSSVVEHSTADREVTGSIPVAPFLFSFFFPICFYYIFPLTQSLMFHFVLFILFNEAFTSLLYTSDQSYH